MSLTRIRRELRRAARAEKARVLQSFFKTGPGEYGEGDLFLGVTVPEIRRIVKQYPDPGRAAVTRLLHSRWHEERLSALFLIVGQFSRQTSSGQGRLYRFYLENTEFINNWDLVDLSAPAIVGGRLLDRSRRPLYALARSASLWERRIAIVATFAFVRKEELEDTFALTAQLLGDREDLIHKAAGWMLREAGKRDRAALEKFLRRHSRQMPRIMLRYAIERFPEPERLAWLKRSAVSPAAVSGKKTAARA